MNWIVRFAAWATVLAVPSHLAAGVYQGLLIRGVALVSGVQIPPTEAGGADLAASNMLGVYAAMCLASTSSPWRRRALALAIGWSAMAAIELGTGLGAIAMGLSQHSIAAPPDWSRTAVDALIALPRFTVAPALWLVLLGRFELPPAWRALLASRPALARQTLARPPRAPN